MPRVMEPVGPRLGRRSLPGLLLIPFFGAGAGRAQGNGTAKARQSIAELYAALQRAMHSGAAFQQRFDLLAPVIDKVFDLNAILQTSVGLRWPSLDETARRTLFAVFRVFTIASYTANFDKDGGEKFEVLPETRASGTDLIVQSKLIASDGEPIRIDYLMRDSGAGWRVVDVLLDGSISRVAVQRSDFRKLLASGDSAPLIDSLRKKVTELSDGAMKPP